MSYSTTNLKKLIYNVLKNDSALVTLLGGSENIFHFYPKQENNIPYPIVVYNIIGIEDNAYNNDRNADINTLLLNIDVFSSEDTITEADNIADRIYALLHTQSISDASVKVFTCSRTSQDEIFEEESMSWRINIHFEITNVAK